MAGTVLLGEPMIQFHRDLAEFAQAHPHFHYHYVTARELYNLVRAAEAGWQGEVAEARDFELVWLAGPRDWLSCLSRWIACRSVHAPDQLIKRQHELY